MGKKSTEVPTASYTTASESYSIMRCRGGTGPKKLIRGGREKFKERVTLQRRRYITPQGKENTEKGDGLSERSTARNYT